MKLLFGLCLSGLCLAARAQPLFPIAALKWRIDSMLQGEPAIVAVAFKDLQTQDTVFIKGREMFHAASTMKTPVLLEVFRQAKEKKFSLDDSLVVTNVFRSLVDSSSFSLHPGDDSELELYQHAGEKRSIRDLAYLMITVSSNLATNMLIDLVGARNVTLTMRAMGLQDLQVLRGVEDQKAYQQGLNNMVTAVDLMKLFEKIATGTAVDKKSSEAMTSMLLDQHFNEIIPARLPGNVRVAHKTGWLKSVNHDGGIVILPDGRQYLLVLLSKNAIDDKSTVKTLATISEIIYQYVNQQPK